MKMRLAIIAIAASLTACSQKSEPSVSAPAAAPALTATEAPKPAPDQQQLTAAANEASKPFKAQEMSAAEEKRVIRAVQNQQTADGASVLQVLQHAQKMRPQEFKLGEFSVLYTTDGKPSSVGVCYWIGSKRLVGDQYCDIAYDISADGQAFTPSVGSAPPAVVKEMTITKLDQGRDAFLRSVDEHYESDCTDFQTQKKIC
ncbi:hypothetical protein ACI48D_08760 [Massilia sp. LXY-6]|uniref:hypothetical protein n=1 Tax=Massilia sp. LXY-6 TaxID=3379823 RepID=UPI003EE3B928